jgi:hypothetical protein
MDEYKDPILKKYANLIEGATKAFKQIYYGDPIRIGVSSLPALVLAKIDTRVGNMTNQEDMHQIRISLTVVTDVRDTINEDKTMVSGVNALYDLMEGRNADYTLKSTSLLYILRHSVELDPGKNLRTDLNSMSRIDYGMTMGKRQENSWSIEGTLELTANFTQPR